MSSYILIKVEDREKSNLKSISNYLSLTIVSALAKDHKFSPCINQRPLGLSSKIEGVLLREQLFNLWVPNKVHKRLLT